MEGQGAGADSELEPEPRLSGARGQTWPAQDKHRLEIKRGKRETQPEPAETTRWRINSTEDWERKSLCCREGGGGNKEGDGGGHGVKKRGRDLDKRGKDGDFQTQHGSREGSRKQKGRQGKGGGETKREKVEEGRGMGEQGGAAASTQGSKSI